MMFRRCKHQWQEVSTSYCEPYEEFSAEYMSRDLIDKLTSGWTIIHLKCATCGDVTSREVLGEYGTVAP